MRWCLRYGAVVALSAVFVSGAAASELPRILSGADNAVPACVTPQALMRFVAERNASQSPPRQIDSRFKDIAAEYRHIGSCVARDPEKCVPVRWDYAFFQMLVETAYLTYRRPGGAPASVVPADNNFAGIGAAVNGRPGERFASVEEGVLAHLQHVLMYSNTRIASPVAKRTRMVQADVQSRMKRLGRPVTYADLTRQWVGGGHSAYERTIQSVADRFAAEFCSGQKVASRQ